MVNILSWGSVFSGFGNIAKVALSFCFFPPGGDPFCELVRCVNLQEVFYHVRVLFLFLGSQGCKRHVKTIPSVSMFLLGTTCQG